MFTRICESMNPTVLPTRRLNRNIEYKYYIQTVHVIVTTNSIAHNMYVLIELQCTTSGIRVWGSYHMYMWFNATPDGGWTNARASVISSPQLSEPLSNSSCAGRSSHRTMLSSDQILEEAARDGSIDMLV